MWRTVLQRSPTEKVDADKAPTPPTQTDGSGDAKSEANSWLHEQECSKRALLAQSDTDEAAWIQPDHKTSDAATGVGGAAFEPRDQMLARLLALEAEVSRLREGVRCLQSQALKARDASAPYLCAGHRSQILLARRDPGIAQLLGHELAVLGQFIALTLLPGFAGVRQARMMAVVASQPPPEESGARCPAWLPLEWGEGAMMQRLLEAANILRDGGTQKRAREAFQEAYTIHMRQNDEMHLAFSAALPLFFESLRTGEKGGYGASCGRGQLTFRKDHSHLDIPACIKLLEGLQSLSRFGDSPPALPPEGCPRWEYVRELCSQAALSLDVARLVYLERRRRSQNPEPQSSPLSDQVPEAVPMQEEVRGPASEKEKGDFSTQLVLDDGQEATSATDSHGTLSGISRESAPNTISIEECARLRQVALVRAGHFLSALQDPMDQLRAEYVSSMDQQMAGRESELLFPSFGKFVEEQLLPLYVRDISISTLGEVMMYYCAIEVDAKDEHRARQLLGVSSQSGLKRKLSVASSAPVTPMGPISQREPTLQDLIQASEASMKKQKMRSEMTTSVVEKRRHGMPAQADYLAPSSVARPFSERRPTDTSGSQQERKQRIPEQRTPEKKLKSSTSVSTALWKSPAPMMQTPPRRPKEDKSPVTWERRRAADHVQPSPRHSMTADWTVFPFSP
ncbi:akr1 [Symbiodinium sp. CCMP2456]|nr:akr1 [Symbiodinium sp. CCMP2456]